MVFDHNKVFTELTADQIKVGSKGYYADNLKALRDAVCTADKSMFGKIEGVLDCSYPRRFSIKEDFEYQLFYLVEEPTEDIFRPYKNVDELIKNFEAHCCYYDSTYKKCNPMTQLIIHVVDKANGYRYMITKYENGSHIGIDGTVHSLDDLFEHYTFLDGSTCGVLL